MSRLHYKMVGPPEAPVLLFLHGFMGSSLDWKESVDLLSRDFKCLTVDLPGHGRTGTCHEPRAYTLEGVSHSLSEVLDILGIPKCALIGYSMGGRLALSFAISHPERCRALVMESASPGIEDPAERAKRRAWDEELARQLEGGDFDTFLTSWYDQPLFESLRRDPVLYRRIVEGRRGNDPVGLAKSLRGMGVGTQPSLWEKLPQLRFPLLFLAGELDFRYKGIARRVTGLCPKARLVVVHEAGHNIHAEKPGDFVRAFEKFLTGQG